MSVPPPSPLPRCPLPFIPRSVSVAIPVELSKKYLEEIKVGGGGEGEYMIRGKMIPPLFFPSF